MNGINTSNIHGHIYLYKFSVGVFIIGHVEKSNLIILIIYKHNCFPFIFKYIIKMFQYTNTNVEYICVNPRSIDVMFFCVFDDGVDMWLVILKNMLTSLAADCTCRTSIYSALFHHVSQMNIYNDRHFDPRYENIC